MYTYIYIYIYIYIHIIHIYIIHMIFHVIIFSSLRITDRCNVAWHCLQEHMPRRIIDVDWNRHHLGCDSVFLAEGLLGMGSCYKLYLHMRHMRHMSGGFYLVKWRVVLGCIGAYPGLSKTL